MLFNILYTVWFASSAKIVYIPFPGAISHHMLGLKIGESLIARGHDFIIANAYTDEKHFSRLDQGNVTVLKYPHPYSTSEFEEWLVKLGKADPISGVVQMASFIVESCDNLLNDAVLEQIRDADTILVDSSVCCGSIVRDFLQIKHRVDFMPITFVDPFYMPRYGAPNYLSRNPQTGSKLSPDALTSFGARVTNNIIYVINQLVQYYVTDPGANGLRIKHGLKGNHHEVMSETGMVIAQTSWAFEFPAAVFPALQLVGPILPSPAKPLPADLEEFVGGVTDGIILVSLGTQFPVTQEIADKLSEGFGQLSLKVLWKTTNIEPSNVPPNVRLVPWIPQNDVLGHPNVKLFFSHGGLNGVSEAAFHGVPVAGFPFIGEQWDNVQRLAYRNMCEIIDPSAFTVESMVATLQGMLKDPSYAKAARKVSSIIQDLPKPPAEQAADWVEYAMRHDSALFRRIPNLDQPWYVESGLDILAFFCLVTLALVSCCFKGCCALCAKSRSHTKTD